MVPKPLFERVERVERVEPLILNRMGSPQLGYSKATEIEEEGARYYSRERFFPFPAKRVIQGDHCWVFGQDNLTKPGTFVFTHFRRKKVISRWGYKDQKQGAASVSRSVQRFLQGGNNPGALWRSEE